jgi:hypothetical protein
MRLETVAAKIERQRSVGDIDHAELVDLLREVARRIKELEGHRCLSTTHDWDVMPHYEGQRGPGQSDW